MDDMAKSNNANMSKPIDLLQFLVSRNLIGYALLDEELVVQNVHGELAGWIPTGVEICESVPPFYGLEGDLAELRDGSAVPLVIPNFFFADETSNKDRMSLEIFWDPSTSKYIVLVHGFGGRSALEVELVKQVRARKLAESSFAKVQKEVDQQAGLFDALSAQAPAAIAVLDRSLRFLFVTKQWIETFHLQGRPVIGETLRETMPGLRETTHDAFLACCDGQAFPPSPDKTALPDGMELQLHWSAQRWLLPDGAVGGLVVMVSSSKEQFARVTALEAQVEKLQQDLTHRDHTISIIAHDLRAPLRNMRQELNELRKLVAQNDTRALNNHIENSLQASDRIDAMIVALQDFALHSNMDGLPVKIDLSVMLPEIGRTVFPDTSWALTLDLEKNIVELPLAPFEIVIRNLMENAVRHHDKSYGKLHFSMTKREDGCYFELVDDGPGLKGMDAERAFEPFVSLSDVPEKTSTGMGLAVSRKIVAQAGGHIDIQSMAAEQRGCCVRIFWPM